MTLDIDSSLVEADKKEAQKTYKGFDGYNPLLAWLDEPNVAIRHGVLLRVLRRLVLLSATQSRMSDWWEKLLRQCYFGEVTHPVFIALSETIRQFDIPIEPFLDLLVDSAETAGYPLRDDRAIARILPILGQPGGADGVFPGAVPRPERARLADSICTGLQLANFWQVVAATGTTAASTCRRPTAGGSASTRRAWPGGVRRGVSRAVGLPRRGRREPPGRGSPLALEMPRGLRLPVALFARAGWLR